MEELRECPFCGYGTRVSKSVITGQYAVICKNSVCEGMLERFNSEQEAIKAWNTRPTPEAINSGLEAFMVAVASELKCLPSFADPNPEGDNAHIMQKLKELTQNEAIKDIEWVGECPHCEDGQFSFECLHCDNSREITRQATMGEVVEVFKEVSDVVQGTVLDKILKVNNGTLRIKEGI